MSSFNLVHFDKRSRLKELKVTIDRTGYHPGITLMKAGGNYVMLKPRLSKSSPFVMKKMIENARRGIYFYNKGAWKYAQSPKYPYDRDRSGICPPAHAGGFCFIQP
jgi:hypothetical protein